MANFTIILAAAALLAAACLVQEACASLATMMSDYKLNKHWKALHDGALQGGLACDAKALNAWLFFGKQPQVEERHQGDLTEWPEKCNLNKLLDEKFERSLGKVYANVRQPVEEILSEEFIERYVRDNDAAAPPVHLSTRANDPEQDCCVPDARSESASRAAIKRLASAGKLELTGDKYDVRRASEKFFEINLVVTCESYWQILHHHMFRGLIGAVNKFRHGDWTYITHQSKAFQSAVFRYQFCRRLVTDMPLQKKYIKALATFAAEAN